MLTLGAPFVSAGCSGPLSTLDPAGPAAQAIGTVWWVMLAGAAAIFLLVVALLTLAFRRGERREASVRKWIVGGGLVFPIVVLSSLLVYALYLGERLLPRGDVEPLRVAAESSQYAWTFTHPSGAGEGAIRTQGELHIPAGRPVDVALTTRDVIHAFWVPRLAGKLDAIPGHINVLRIEADEPGVYPGVCAEYCGIGHARHVFRVIAHDTEGWARFQRGGSS
jgi:cytochrome c oxidase subunit II